MINRGCIFYNDYTSLDRLIYRDRNRRIVIDALDYCRKNKGLNIWAYVIMTNHIHLIVSAKEYLSDVLRDFKRHTTKELLLSIQDNAESRRWMLNAFSVDPESEKKDDVRHQIWASDNHPVEMESAKFILQKMGYIHENPVHAGFVDDPAAWVYSSQTNYMGLPSLLEIDLLDI